MVTVHFSVAVSAELGNGVYVVGSCEELGSWLPHKALQLNKSDQTIDDRTVWVGTCSLGEKSSTVDYRYFTGYDISAESCGTAGEPNVGVTRWEGGLLARNLSLSDASDGNLCLPMDQFGVIGTVNVSYPGWLTVQSEVRLSFHDHPFHMWGRAPTAEYSLRCLPFDISQESDDDDSDKFMQMNYVDLVSDDPVYCLQPPNGVPCKQDSYLCYAVQTTDLHHLAVRIEVYNGHVTNNTAESCPLIGTVTVPPSCFTASTGSLQLSVISTSGKVKGQITVDYLVVNPIAGLDHQMASSTALEWDRCGEPLDIGHRGMGKCRSVQVAPFVKENTIQCFNQAADHGADFVEFDVQLTKDNVVVVYHDFLCRLPCHANGSSSSNWHDAPVQDLTYDQLLKLSVSFANETGTLDEKVEEISLNGTCSDSVHARLFPTLAQTFDLVQPELGFNIEIKYPLELQSGELEDGLKYYFDMNAYVDSMVKEVLKTSGNRRVVFSCFHPDVCIMLRLKQNRFPVMLITQGRVKRYKAFKDPRASNIHMALHMANAENFMALNTISEYILTDVSVMKKARDWNLVIMCWGGENNDKVVIKQLKTLGVHAVHYDRLNEFIDEEKSNKSKQNTTKNNSM